jgi:hypothetical protein
MWRAGAPTHRTGVPHTPWGSGRVAREAAYRDKSAVETTIPHAQ